MSFSNLDTLYRQVIMDHYKNPRNKGSVEGDALTIDMNNPTCGDRIQLQLQVEDGVVQDAKFTGEGCSISMSSASMMTQAIKGKNLDDALNMSKAFSEMMLGEDVDTADMDMGDVEALQGVSQFPARIKCATLAWKAMEKGVKEE
ncbi:nitrogen fixation protein NifU [Lentibacillus halodurans]|uniref:Nitrogen fixation protein NifU n=1 Tax=Lentibacillus halodurans TaxID=237679 RepID=A0A1I0WPN3_9BACI|nr:SUF system NifU family Fe-S cluster assembly protein [Lentibacillus halodurans]SFA90729.1 nitrogen fixation protein NifU [Lentibacillus halodurans]